MEKTEFQQFFEAAKNLPHFEEKWDISEKSHRDIWEEWKVLARELMYYDKDAGMLMLFLFHWTRHRTDTSRDVAYRDFSKYLEWLDKNSPHT